MRRPEIAQRPVIENRFRPRYGASPPGGFSAESNLNLARGADFSRLRLSIRFSRRCSMAAVSGSVSISSLSRLSCMRTEGPRPRGRTEGTEGPGKQWGGKEPRGATLPNGGWRGDAKWVQGCTCGRGRTPRERGPVVLRHRLDVQQPLETGHQGALKMLLERMPAGTAPFAE